MYDVYENREFSWLKFNERVLEEANDPQTPPLEKLRFMSIVVNNLDEFFMVRVGTLSDHILTNADEIDDKSGISAKELHDKIFKKTEKFYETQNKVFKNIITNLAEHHVKLLKMSELSPEQLTFVKDTYFRQIAPILSTLILDGKATFPHLENRFVNICFHLKKKEKHHIAFVLKSSSIPHILRLPSENGTHFILTDNVILHYAGKFFPNYEVLEKCLVKITRNADLEMLEGWYDEDVDYRDMMKSLIKKRIRLTPVRIEVSKDLSEEFKKLIANNLDKKIVLINKTPLSFNFLHELEKILTRSQKEFLSYPPLEPKIPSWFDENQSMTEKVYEGDLLLSYPFESTKPFFKLLEEAANDKSVSAIKITIYRLSSNSRLVNLLLRACENGKDVVVAMELRARFDEANNINYSEILESAGATVIYGLPQYKVHSKVMLIEKTDNKDIVHIGTGNYNEKTAKLYTDLNIITANEKICEDSKKFFKNVVMDKISKSYNTLLFSPFGMMESFMRLIDDEIEFQKQFQNGHIIMKFNSLTSKKMIDKLVEASREGVKIELIVRGICCLIPGIKNKTENITVTSIVGRFLEHSRVYYFNHNNEKKMFISSADLMTRNLERRIEVACPVLSDTIKNRIYKLLLVMISDDVKSRVLDKRGTYRKKDTGFNLNSQLHFFEEEIT